MCTGLPSFAERVTWMREAQDVCSEHKDVASVGLLDGFIDQAEQRAWSLRNQPDWGADLT
jgi:hypothetical protein